MKIIQMNLDDFGIYHNVEWQPPEKGLIVMHGRNESGKTTLMKYVRSMFFGYGRGEWRGFFGHMDIRRHNGREYRIYRNEKESYICDREEILHEEPANLWWHGLDRQTYDKIFAIGLEDLQGFKILSNEEVRSHFFSIEGGVRMGVTRRDISRLMGELLVASPQGKKPINVLLQEQKEFSHKIQQLSYDEEEFAQLQEWEEKTHTTENRLRLEREETQLQMEKAALSIAAWEVYRREQEALKKMRELADVAQFSQSEAEQWQAREKEIKRLQEEEAQLREQCKKEPAYCPEWKRWEIGADKLEEIYSHTAEWRQQCEELRQQEEADRIRRQSLKKVIALLQPWTGDTIAAAVPWEEAAALYKKYEQGRHEWETWQAGKPKALQQVKACGNVAADADTEESWKKRDEAVSALQDIIREREKIQVQMTCLQGIPATSGKAVLWAGAVWSIVTIALAGSSMAGVFHFSPAIYGAAIAAVLCFLQYGRKRRGPKAADLQLALAGLEGRMAVLRKEAAVDLAVTASNEQWRQALDEIRTAYVYWRTKASKNEWEKEQQAMYAALVEKWRQEGAAIKTRLADSEKSWEQWCGTYGFVALPVHKRQEAEQAWKTWRRLVTEQQEWQIKKQEIQQRLRHWQDETEQLFREIGIQQEASFTGAVAAYKQWQEIHVQGEVAREQDRQLALQREQLIQLQKKLQEQEAQQEQVLLRAGVKTEGEFRSKVLKYKQFCQYKEVYEQSEAHLRLLAKTPQILKELRHELQVHTMKNWTEEKAYYERKIKEIEKKIREVAEKRGSIVERLSQMAKNEESSRILQKRQIRQAELDQQVDRWLVYMFAEYMLGEAQAYYERVRQPLVIRQAGTYLQRMTAGRYTLQASFDGKQLYAVDESQHRIPEKQWSSGLGDQIYLAIRISLAAAFSKQLEPMPIILDDILVRFDEDRQKEALRFLAEMGEKEQIFLFTCSQATKELALAVQREDTPKNTPIQLFEIEKGRIQSAICE